MLLLLDIILLPMLFFIGLITSYEDLKYGKVRNKWIKLGLRWGLGVFAFLIVWRFIASPITRFFYLAILKYPAGSPMPVYSFNLDFLAKSLANVALASLIGFSMWKFNAWAAGDAKLFIVYSLLIPVFHYQKSYFAAFPSFVLLINVFLIFLIYLLINSVFYSLKLLFGKTDNLGQSAQPATAANPKKTDKFSLKSIIRLPQKAALMLLFPFCVLMLFNFLQNLIKKYSSFDLQSFQAAVFALLIIFSQKIGPRLKKPAVIKTMVLILIIICLYGLWANPTGILNIVWRTLKNMLVFMVIFLLFQKLVNFYIEKTHGKKIPIDQLQPGMLVDQAVLKMIEPAAKNDSSINGINAEQIANIKTEFLKLSRTEIEIHKTASFAPWLFFGAIATLATQISLLGWLFGFIKI